ncbi:MAG TPA: type II toxin-antitoxin system prevent-host-death family antitoxin, partial [bacterium]|nr:type II toxin-antitoxin system prevent-host-death family antitoxin [bacterium]
NRIGQVLRQVERGQEVRITVNGRPVADLVPIRKARRNFVPRDAVAQLIVRAPLDRAFTRKIATVTGATIEAL